MKFIDEMRQRPEEERLAFSVMVAGAVALVLFFLWGATFFRSDKNIVSVEISSQKASAVDGFQEVGNNVTSAVSEFSAQYSQLKKVLNSSGVQSNSTFGGKNTVNLSVDENGAVQVENIIIENKEQNAAE